MLTIANILILTVYGADAVAEWILFGRKIILLAENMGEIWC